MKESDIVKEMIAYLLEKKHFAYKHYGGGGFGRKGVSDIIGCKYPDGTAFFLEVKKPGLDADDKQKEFQFEASMAGAITAVVHSVDEIKKLGL